jgi:hypothetical protein
VGVTCVYASGVSHPKKHPVKDDITMGSLGKVKSERLLKKGIDYIVTDRTIMSPLINQWPFYPQTSLEKLPRTALLLNRKSRSLRQPHPYQRLLHMC